MPAGRGAGCTGTHWGAGSARAADSAGTEQAQEVMGAGAGPGSLWRRLSGRGQRARSPPGGRAGPGPAGRPGPLGALALAASNSPQLLAASSPPPPRDLLPVGAPLGRGPAPAAGTGSADLASGAAHSPPCAPALSGKAPRGLSIPGPCSESEPGAGPGRPAPASHWAPRARGWGRRAGRGEEGAGPRREAARAGRPRLLRRALPAPGARTWPSPRRSADGSGVDHFGPKKMCLSACLTFSSPWRAGGLLACLETELPVQPDRGAQDCGGLVSPDGGPAPPPAFTEPHVGRWCPVRV